MKSKILLFTAGMILASVNTFSQVTANFNSSDTIGCAPLIADFFDTSTGSILTWTWNFGDGGSATTQNPTHIYSVPGIYTVSLRVGSFNGTDTLIRVNYINVLASPIANFTSSSNNACSGDTIHFINTTIPGSGLSISYVWTFGDGSPAAGGIDAFHSYFNLTTVTQPYVTTLSANDINGCTSFYSYTVYISPVPNASISIDSVSQGGIPVTIYFSNTSIGSPVYNWDFGDPGSGVNNTSNLSAPSHIYDSLGIYYVLFTIGNPGCQAQDSLMIDVNSIVGISDPIGKETRIYPNPVTDYLILENGDIHSQNKIIRIYDLSGKIVLEKETAQDGKKIMIDVSGLRKGIYLIQNGNFNSRFDKN